jgi:hypothetical protein
MFIFVGLSSLADTLPSYIGNYAWRSDDNGVAQSVRTAISQQNGSTTINTSLTWIPGAAVEIQATVTSDHVRTVVIDSRDCTEITFSFSDSFKNEGVAKLVLCGDTADLTLDETTMVEPRAVRQYGDYHLTRQP